MNQETPNSNPVTELTRCQKHTRKGRCRMLVADPSSTLCAEHSRTPSKNRNSVDLSALLTAGLTEFKSAIPINDFLSRLLLHQAEGRIPPRRAAVMAYTCNLLLRTLPAIDRELGIGEEPAQLDFSDWPGRVRVEPGDIPPPRSLAALQGRRPRHTCGRRRRTRWHPSPRPVGDRSP